MSAITRETFITCPIETLKTEMGSNGITDIFLSTFDNDWIALQTPDDLVKFTGRVFVVSPLGEYSIGMKAIWLISRIYGIRKFTTDNLNNFCCQVLEEAYEYSPADFKVVAIYLNSTLKSNSVYPGSLNDKTVHLGILETALAYHSTKIRDIYFQNLPLDAYSPHGHNLFSLTCAYGTVDDFLRALDTYEETKGQEALKSYVEYNKRGKDRDGDIRRLLKRNKNFPNAKEKIVDYYRSKDLEPPLFLTSKELSSIAVD